VDRRYSIFVMMVAAGILASSVSGATHTTTVPQATGRTTTEEHGRDARAASNPLLPASVAVEGFFPELSLVEKLPTMTPAGFEPLYTAQDWAAYRAKFGAAADDLPRKKSSGQFAFANSLIAAAEGKDAAGVESTNAEHGRDAHATTPGMRRLLLVRAAAICYRSTGGFATANKAVEAYEKEMDIRSPAQVGALWTIANSMSRMSVTPRDERIRYSGIAARANTQLALLMVVADQVEAADKVIKMVGYHEGWLKSDPAMRATIAQTRTVVRQTITMMDYLGTQYRPAIKGDDSALMALFLYGRFVKKDAALVADFPGRKPGSPMAQLAEALNTAEHDAGANFTVAETLRTVSETLPDGVLKQRTLYASLERYRKFMHSPETERERVKRTLAQMAIEAAVADGAKPGITIRPFEVGKPAQTQPAELAPSHLAMASRLRNQR
jgi:hypothetical protein